MHVRKLLTERFQDYKLPNLYLAACWCDWKCCIERQTDISLCQNSPIANLPVQDVPDNDILDAYEADPITQAIVIAGLEPVMQIYEVVSLIRRARERKIHTDFVIYTGYTKEEVRFCGVLDLLTPLCGDGITIIIKYGRYVPGQQPHFDAVLGVDLASDNQYAEYLS